MTVHVLTASLSLPLSREQVFAFFAEASNLERITPPALRFHIRSPAPIEMRQGQVIDYRLRLFGVPFLWRTLITRWDPPYEFVDEQLRGPYASWQHTHRFHRRGDTTVIEDVVRYRLPLGLLGDMVHPLVRLQLRYIFDYRRRAVERYFLGGSAGGGPGA